MKYILETYGRFLVEGAVVALILGLLFSVRDMDGNDGIFKMLGGVWKSECIDEPLDVGFQVYESEAAKEFPTIDYVYKEKVVAGEIYSLETLFQTAGEVGEVFRRKVLKITDDKENDNMNCYDEATQSICFPKEGIYQIVLSVKDTANKKYTCAIYVPVNKRG